MYTSQLHSLRDVIISRRTPGRSLVQPPLGILLALPLGNDSSIYPLPSDHISSTPPPQFYTRRPSLPVPPPADTAPAHFHMAIPRLFPARLLGCYPPSLPKFSFRVKKIPLETDLGIPLFLGTKITVP